jgi:hypothetical protein
LSNSDENAWWALSDAPALTNDAMASTRSALRMAILLSNRWTNPQPMIQNAVLSL